MELTAAVISIRSLTLAVILVPPELTHPVPGAQLIADAARIFPTLPVMLVSPRIGGFSRSYAHFDVAGLLDDINTDTIAWRRYATTAGDDRPLPF